MGAKLIQDGYRVIELGEFAKGHALYDSYDRERGTYEVDPERLDRALAESLPPGTVFLIGHLSHLVTTDRIIVLRCRPSVLAERLRARGWKEAKVRENAEAEACDVILIESVESSDQVFEIDTTQLSPEDVHRAVLGIMAGEREKYEVGHVDWSGEVLDWF